MSLIPRNMYSVSGFFYLVLIPIYLTNGCIMPRKLFYIIHAENTFSNIPGMYEEIWTWSYRRITFYMSNVDALKTVLNKTCKSCTFMTKSSYWCDARHAKDCESRVICSWDNVEVVDIPFDLNISNYHATSLTMMELAVPVSVYFYIFILGQLLCLQSFFLNEVPITIDNSHH